MFGNLTLFRFPLDLDLDDLEASLEGAALKPVGPLDLASSGFVPPFGRDSVALSHGVGRVVWLTMGTEKRLLPPAVVNATLAERLAALEKQTGRAPGGRKRKEIKEEVLNELLPKAFVQPGRVDMTIDRSHGFLAVDTTSRNAAESAASLLRLALGSFPALPLNAEVSVRSIMTGWLAGEELPEGFILAEDVELHGGTDGDVWKGSRADLEGDEVRFHLEHGKQAVKVGLIYEDRVSFTLCEDLVIRKFKLLDLAWEQLDGHEMEDKRAELDARYALSAAEIRKLFLALEGVLKFSPVST